MPTEHFVKSALDKVRDAFELYLSDGITPMVLSVNVRKHARDLQHFLPVATEALNGLAVEIDTAAADKKGAKSAIRKLETRFLDWRKDTLQKVKGMDQQSSDQDDAIAAALKITAERSAEMVRKAEEAVAAKRKAFHEDLDAARTAPPAPPVEPTAEAAAADPVEDELAAEVESMSIEDIEAILKKTTRNL